MTSLKNKTTSVVMDDWNLDESMPVETKFGIFGIFKVYNETLSRMTGIWMKSHLVSDNTCNVGNLYIMPKCICKERETMFKFTFSVGDPTWAVCN